MGSFTIQDSDDCDLEHEDRQTKRKRLFNKYVIYLFATYLPGKGIYITLTGLKSFLAHAGKL